MKENLLIVVAIIPIVFLFVWAALILRAIYHLSEELERAENESPKDDG